MINIYVLELVNNKYYVGKTSKSVNDRFAEHASGNGSLWTKIYPPIRILKIINNGDNFDEDKYTKLYMNIYGIDNVRGGTYITQYLTQQEKQFIRKEIWAATNVCTRCGFNTHFINQCFAKKDINGNFILTKNKRNIQSIKTGLIDETKNDLIDERKNNLMDETKNNLVSETKNNLVDETKNNLIDETKNNLIDETKMDLIDETKNNLIDETKMDWIDETKMDLIDETKIEPIDETKIDLIDEITAEPIDKTTINEPINETIIELTYEPVFEPANETIIDSINETINKLVNKNTYLLNRGKKWTKTDEKYLFNLLISKKSIKEISNLIGRTSTAIESRIATIIVRYCFDNNTNNILSAIIN